MSKQLKTTFVCILVRVRSICVEALHEFWTLRVKWRAYPWTMSNISPEFFRQAAAFCWICKPTATTYVFRHLWCHTSTSVLRSVVSLISYVYFVQNLKNVSSQEIDNSNGVIFIFYDPDTNMVYLCGKVINAWLGMCVCFWTFMQLLLRSSKMCGLLM